jgi:hypothetical protein
METFKGRGLTGTTELPQEGPQGAKVTQRGRETYGPAPAAARWYLRRVERPCHRVSDPQMLAEKLLVAQAVLHGRRHVPHGGTRGAAKELGVEAPAPSARLLPCAGGAHRPRSKRRARRPRAQRQGRGRARSRGSADAGVPWAPVAMLGARIPCGN